MNQLLLITVLQVRALQLPGEGGGAEDGGVGLLELGEDELHLAAPQRDDILVHGLADRFLQEFTGTGEAAEQDDGLRSGEFDEVGELLAENPAGVVEHAEGERIAFLRRLVHVLGLDLVQGTEEGRLIGHVQPFAGGTGDAGGGGIGLQAAFLAAKLPHLERMNMERRRIAAAYSDGIKNDKVIIPYVLEDMLPVWHVYGIRCKERDALEKHLNKKGIGTNKHYPIPMHMQECYRDLNIPKGRLPIAEEISNTELSIPMYYGMTIKEIQYVIDAINEFR